MSLDKSPKVLKLTGSTNSDAQRDQQIFGDKLGGRNAFELKMSSELGSECTLARTKRLFDPPEAEQRLQLNVTE